jgi:hypothetical protein
LHALLKVDNLVVPFSFPYLAPVKAQPGFIPRGIKPRVVEIEKRPPQPSTVTAQEISPHEPGNTEGIAAVQEPYFE